MKIPSLMLALVAIVASSAFGQTSEPAPSATTAPQTTSPTLSPTTPNPSTDEVMARRKLEDAGYKDVRGLGVTPDGKISGTAVGNNGETKVEVDSTGTVGESR